MGACSLNGGGKKFCCISQLVGGRIGGWRLADNIGDVLDFWISSEVKRPGEGRGRDGMKAFVSLGIIRQYSSSRQDSFQSAI